MPFLLVVPILTSIDVFKYYVTHTYSGVRPIEDLISTDYIWIIPAIALFIIQKRRLEFRTINVTVDKDTFKEAVENTARELEWKINKATNETIIAKVVLVGEAGANK